jgi:hypothetical protein
MENKDSILEIKGLRQTLDGIHDLIVRSIGSSREVSLTLTSLQLGRMWLGKALAPLGTEYPYPNSTDSSNEDIEPEADKLEDGEVCYDVMKGEELTHIKKIKQLRELLDDIVGDGFIDPSDIQDAMRGQSDTVTFEYALSLSNAYTYICEAKMWLGVELGNQRTEN